MARPRSDDKRNAIMSAATRIIAAQGLGAATAAIAKEAQVSNGSLFTYFGTKADLFNQLYVALKTELAVAAMDGVPKAGNTREQTLHMWSNWLHWLAASPEKRRTIAQLNLSDDISADSRQTTHLAMTGVAVLLERSRLEGAMHDAPLPLVVSLMSAIADTTVDFMIDDPANAEMYCMTALDAAWRMLA
jgi:AcrR family transcriptional regulator